MQITMTIFAELQYVHGVYCAMNTWMTYSYTHSHMHTYIGTRLVPRPFPAFQCCMLKSGRAWYMYLKSHV